MICVAAWEWREMPPREGRGRGGGPGPSDEELARRREDAQPPRPLAGAWSRVAGTGAGAADRLAAGA